MSSGDSPEHAEELEKLRQQFPGWQIWTSGPTWCARPWPLINCGSAEELAGQIRAAHMLPPSGSPSLAAWRSYRARARALREYEEAAAAAWNQRKAAQAGRGDAGTADPVERFRRWYGRQAAREAGAPRPQTAASAGGGEPGPA